MSDQPSCDLAIIGGGLAGGLIALAMQALHPDARMLLIEEGVTLGGNHVWSFFDGDVPADARWLIDRMIGHRWPLGHEVRFGAYRRRLDAPYNSIASQDFDAYVRRVLGDRVRTGARAVAVAPDQVTLADGRRIAAGAVIDARGISDAADLAALRCGWQKFVGQRLALDAPHGLDRPVIMDATVAQVDGYRFVYLLPIDDRTVFVEDTYYSDDAALDAATLRERIAAYALAQGWGAARVEHEEQGVLAVVHGGDFERFWPGDDPIARAGARGGLFHPMTGYSLPEAVSFALALAERWPMDGRALAAFSRGYARAHWRRGGYYRLLGRMLFRAAAPQERHRIFARFYRLPQGLIGRFYAGRSTPWDKARILCGRPPVPIRSAVKAMMKRGA